MLEEEPYTCMVFQPCKLNLMSPLIYAQSLEIQGCGPLVAHPALQEPGKRRQAEKKE